MGKPNKKTTIKNECNRTRIARLVEYMGCSPLGAEIVNWLEQEDITLRLDKSLPKTEAGNTCEPYDTITLNPQLSDLNLLMTIAHETRHLWQARRFSDMEKLDDLRLNSHFLLNPWAKCIFTRFLEADAFSFQYVFMLDYIASYFKSENFPFDTLPLDFDEVTYRTLDTLEFNLESLKDGLPDLAIHRKAAFEEFFNTGQMSNYDLNSINYGSSEGREHLCTALSEVFNAKAGEPHAEDDFIKTHLNFLKEDHLKLFGESAFGELKGANYLLDKNGRFVMKDSYSRVADPKIRSILDEFTAVSARSGINTLTRANGKKQKLISL